MELHKVLIGMSLVVVMLFGFIFFIAEGVTEYAPTSIPNNYQDSFSNITANLDELSDISADSSSQTSVNSSSGSALNFDFLGFFFGQGYRAASTFITGFQIMDQISDDIIVNTIPDSPLADILKSQLLVIVLIVVVSLLLHFIIKSDRI